jgi:hypothetical protein
MRVVLASAAVLACAVSALASLPPASADTATTTTTIRVNGSGGDLVYDGVGAVLGGGGNARYLADYPPRQRDQIMDYLFKPGYGAQLQILKLEVGGDSDSSDGAEPSIEHTRGHVNCAAGYELSIARQAVRLNPAIRLYGLQWDAPGWVSAGSRKRFSPADISYLLSWLGCARRHGLTISYLGGWNESDSGDHRPWFRKLRQALDRRGYRHVQIVAADSSGTGGWHYVGDSDIAILGAHDVCGAQTGMAGPATACTSPWSRHDHADPARQPMWASELGGMAAGAQPGCDSPCAPAMDRGVIRGFVDARLTGFLEWPVLDAMPPGLPYENRGLVTADQPWSGSYNVNAMTWAIAQLTQFAQPPSRSGVRWRYETSASGLLSGRAADGSYETLVRDPRGSRRGSAWSTIIEATTATATQRASFRVTGGQDLAGRTVHVWASNFSRGGDPSQWFEHEPDLRPDQDGRFGLTIRPGWVYSLSTTGGHGHGTAGGAARSPFPLPLRDALSNSGHAARMDDEPADLAAQDGAFELARCRVPDRGDRTCTAQEAVATPVIWHRRRSAGLTHFPYAVIGDQTMTNYSVSVDVLLTSKNASAGVIGRFGCRMAVPDTGEFDGYVFNVSATGRWQLIRNANRLTEEHSSPACPAGPPVRQTLSAGALARPLTLNKWTRLTLSMAGSSLSAAVNGRVVASVSDSAWTSGPAGIEAGAFSTRWPNVQYSHLSIQRPLITAERSKR